jgi:Phosphotransferase enzyme family
VFGSSLGLVRLVEAHTPFANSPANLIAMELLAVGRTAEVFAFGEGRVVKLDRPEWNGLSHYEAGVVRSAFVVGLPVPEVFEIVTIEGRQGTVFERLHGPTLSVVVNQGHNLDDLAEQFVGLQSRISSVALPGIPDLVPRLANELDHSGLPDRIRSELRRSLESLADQIVGQLCHFDLHPDNIIVTDRGWVVIDWLTAANGPPIADVARSVLLRAHATNDSTMAFITAIHRVRQRQESSDDDRFSAWTRILAGARLAEGFDGSYATWLARIATGDIAT